MSDSARKMVDASDYVYQGFEPQTDDRPQGFGYLTPDDKLFSADLLQ